MTNPNVAQPKVDSALPASSPAAPAPAAAVPPKPAATTGQSSVISHQSSVTSQPAAAPVPPPPAPLLPNPLAYLPLPFHGVDYAARGYHVEATIAPEQVVFAAEQLDKEGFALDTITGVDWMAEGQMEVIYDYFHPAKALHVVVRTRIPRDNPEIATIQKVFPGANWHEREAHDFFGIRFLGHPNLTPFLLPEDADYHPLRKDFAL
jgi:NADH-quinone oxidoreductase subunit C